jgi:hypothetical protein
MTVAKLVSLLVLLWAGTAYSQGLVTGTFFGNPNTLIIAPPYSDPDYTFYLVNATFVYSGNYTYSYGLYIRTVACSSSFWSTSGCTTTVDSISFSGSLFTASTGSNLQTGALGAINLLMDSDSSCTCTKNSGLNFCPWTLASASGSIGFGYRRSVDTNTTSTVVSALIGSVFSPTVVGSLGVASYNMYRPFYTGYLFPYIKIA